MQQGMSILDKELKPGLTVVTASAGSGKTHLLTEKYIELLLRKDAGGRVDTESYKHILAVTFTNKATDEMKDRIIKRLTEFPAGSDAHAILVKLLHDYSCFSVSTIDKFFQNVMRAFAREMDQYASYRVELDTKTLLAQVVDLMLDSMENPAQDTLLKWLKQYAFEQVEASEGWNITAPLKEMAEQFFKEPFLLKRREAGGFSPILENKQELEAFIKELGGIIGGFESTARNLGKKAVAFLTDRGFCQGKPNSSVNGFFKMDAGDFDVKQPGERFRNSAERNVPGLNVYFGELDALVEESEKYHSALAIRAQVYQLGIYADLQRFLQDYLRENNVVLLQMSTDILNRLIDDSDTPFVYEKIGNRYDHLMLDEAQDTSRMQWDNFQPLYANSVALHNRNLIVGDIKQSIYRWRGSDWHLMDRYIKKNPVLEQQMHEDTLSENWRSGLAVINFNNEVFSKVGAEIAKDGEEGTADIGGQVSRIYGEWDGKKGSFEQTLPDKRQDEPEGHVRVRFVPKGSEDRKAYRSEIFASLLKDIEELRGEGYAHKNITILVRKNREGAEVAQWLMQNGIQVITEDSLEIGTSPCICKLMVKLGGKVNPEDPVNLVYQLHPDDSDVTFLPVSLYETCEQLLHDGSIACTEHDLPFINAFLDAVLDYQEKYGSSLRGFVDWWNETGRKQKICAPDGEDAVRVMTIHKSKGLSLDAVIIPFCAEPFTPNLKPTIWCEAKTWPFNKIGLVPLKASSALLKTVFKDDYLQEKCLEYIDSINTWYVAFTRARSRLRVYVPFAKKEPKQNPKKVEEEQPVYKAGSIENVLYRILKDRLDNDLVFETGTNGAGFQPKKDENQKTDDPQRSLEWIPIGSRLKLSMKGKDYFAEEETPRLEGIKKHRDMASVIQDEELERLSGGRHWFDGTHLVYNESSIVTGNGEIYRPDRVLVSRDGRRVIVIDYKFGQAHDSYRWQVLNYMKLMRGMGYPEVEGWLWYVTRSEVVRV